MSNAAAEINRDNFVEKIIPFIKTDSGVPSRVAIFLSGAGTNAIRILEKQKESARNSFEVVALFTDRPKTSNAQNLATEFGIPVVDNDIKQFYRERGCARVSIATDEGKSVREAWTNAVRTQLAPFRIDFALFAGFIPLTNLAGDFPCLNVHPGDLTYKKDGKRYLVGLHTVPIERAILEGLSSLRSSVIVAAPYFEDAGNMDTGPILGISDEVLLILDGHRLQYLRECAARRSPVRPRIGYQDDLEKVAKSNQERLKEFGDWQVFPKVVEEFSRGNYGVSESGILHYKKDQGWVPITTVIFGTRDKEFLLS